MACFFELAPAPQSTTVVQYGFGEEEPQISIGARQVGGWGKCLELIGWCWESNCKFNFHFPLHWWPLGKGADLVGGELGSGFVGG
jgi:hypothetical protein